MKNTLNEIKSEIYRQNKKWGEQNHSVIEWQAILMEEVGEAAKEAVDYHFRNPVKYHSQQLGEFYGEPSSEKQLQRLIDYRKELIQIAAVAVQMVECLDRNGR